MLPVAFKLCSEISQQISDTFLLKWYKNNCLMSAFQKSLFSLKTPPSLNCTHKAQRDFFQTIYLSYERKWESCIVFWKHYLFRIALTKQTEFYLQLFTWVLAIFIDMLQNSWWVDRNDAFTFYSMSKKKIVVKRKTSQDIIGSDVDSQ